MTLAIGSLVGSTGCSNSTHPADPLTKRVADRCGVSATEIQYTGQLATYGTSEILEWWADDGSFKLTLSRKLIPSALGWQLTCGSGSASIPITISKAELDGVESSASP